MQHDAGMICITAVLDLLLAVASPLMDPSTDVHQIMCAGLPALLRCVASPSTGGWVAQELLGLMLDRLATDSSLNLLPAAVKLEGAVQVIVKAVCMFFLDPPDPFACKDHALCRGLVMKCSHSLQWALEHQTYFVWSLASPAAASPGCQINRMEQFFVSCEPCNLLICGFAHLQLPNSTTKSLGIFKWKLSMPFFPSKALGHVSATQLVRNSMQR